MIDPVKAALIDGSQVLVSVAGLEEPLDHFETWMSAAMRAKAANDDVLRVGLADGHLKSLSSLCKAARGIRR